MDKTAIFVYQHFFLSPCSLIFFSTFSEIRLQSEMPSDFPLGSAPILFETISFPLEGEQHTHHTYDSPSPDSKAYLRQIESFHPPNQNQFFFERNQIEIQILG